MRLIKGCKLLMGFNLRVSIRLINGYTLMEAMIVLAIVSMIATFSLPGLTEYYTESSAHVIETQIVQLLHRAIKESQTRHLSMGICMGDEKGQCLSAQTNHLILFIDSDLDGQIHDPQQLIQVLDLSESIGKLNWRSYPHYRNYLLFTSGNDEDDNATFWFCQKGQSMPTFVIKLNKVGMISVSNSKKSNDKDLVIKAGIHTEIQDGISC